MTLDPLPISDHQINKDLSNHVESILNYWIRINSANIKIDTHDSNALDYIPSDLTKLIKNYSFHTEPSTMFPNDVKFGYDKTCREEANEHGSSEYCSLLFHLAQSKLVPFKFNLGIKREIFGWTKRSDGRILAKPYRSLQYFPLTGVVEMFAREKVRLFFDYRSMKRLIDEVLGCKELTNNKCNVQLFRWPEKWHNNKKQLMKAIEVEYLRRATDVLIKYEPDLDEVQRLERVAQVYKKTKYYHKKYETLCQKYGEKPLYPFIGTNDWFVELRDKKAQSNRKEKNTIANEKMTKREAVLLCDGFVCTVPMDKPKLVGQFRD